MDTEGPFLGQPCVMSVSDKDAGDSNPWGEVKVFEDSFVLYLF